MNRYLFVVGLLAVILNGSALLHGAIVEGLTLKAATVIGEYAYNQFYNNDPHAEKKEILNEYLYDLDVHHDAVVRLRPHGIARGCERDFTPHCNQLAEHFKNMEIFYAKKGKVARLKKHLEHAQDPRLCRLFETDLAAAQIEEMHEGHPVHAVSFFASLSDDQQEKLLHVARDIDKEKNGEHNYPQEFSKIIQLLSRESEGQ